MSEVDNTQKAALTAEVLREAAFDGWTEQAFATAVERSDMPYEAALLLFPRGIEDVIPYYIAQCDARMCAALEQEDLQNMRIRDRIATAVMARIGLYVGHKEAIRKLVAHFAMPYHKLEAAQHVSHTVSLMWYAAGDTATDFNYYSKRFLLAGVYTSTLLYWLQDHSEDLEATEAFLRRRIDDVMQIQKVKANCTASLERLRNLPFIRQVFM